MYRDTNCKLQAHRGVSTDAPENTMTAFRLAVEAGVDMIIANGETPEILYDLFDGKAIGTRFSGKKAAV